MAIDQAKRSMGITILAWTIIVSSVLNLSFNLLASAVNPLISVYFYFLISIVSIVAGIFLLLLKSWARVTVIFVCLMVAVENIATAPYAVGKLGTAEGGMDAGLKMVMYALVGSVVLFQGGVVFFLTRSKIKGQFK